MSLEMALAAYRNLLRSAHIAFRGDTRMLSAARLEARKHFESNRGLATDSDEYTKQVTHAHEVAKFLRENVVQGQATGADANYRLNIHEHTERGNNEDIKKGNGNTLAGTKCCSA